MLRSIVRACFWLGLSLLLSGCDLSAFQQGMAIQTDPPPLPAQPLYVLATNVYEGQRHELVIVDWESWQVTHRTPLLAGAPQHLSRDPMGRIWIGYGAYPGHVDRRV